ARTRATASICCACFRAAPPNWPAASRGCRGRSTACDRCARVSCHLRRIASMKSPDATPKPNEHPFAPYVRLLGKGRTGSRSLNREGARDALAMILGGEVSDVRLGAFLMLLRVKEESPEELAGFVAAARVTIAAPAIAVDLDWSSYAGKP